MVNALPVFRVLGGLLIAFAGAMSIPLATTFYPFKLDDAYFVIGISACLFVGVACFFFGQSEGSFELDRRQGFLITVSSWVVLPAFAAIPLLEEGLTFTDAYFEAVSALTTTGATVMSGLDDTPKSILLWRSILQFIGGVGIVVMGIIMMPFLRVGGMQLFHTESSDKSEKIVGRAFDMIAWIGGIYVALNIVAMLTYRVLGMDWFDAINHAMTSISTGGFSTHDASFGFFEAPALHWAGTIFMISGALPFVAYIRLAKGKTTAFLRDIQIRAFLAFLFCASLLIGATLHFRADEPLHDAMRLAFFNVTSIVTTTGYATADYQLWGPFAVGAFFILTFVGGCSGSTSGAIKIYRFQILGRLAHAFLSRLVTPSRVQPVIYNDRRVDDDTAFAIVAFLAVMLFSLVAATFALAWVGVDFITALTASATSLTNVGPGLGPVVGPAGNFQPLPDPAKWILSLLMILGRLEFFAFFVLLTPEFWRR